MHLPLLLLVLFSASVLSHPQPHSIQPRPNVIADFHVIVDHNPSRSRPSSINIAEACAGTIHLLCQQLKEPSHSDDQWTWTGNEGCRAGYWSPSHCQEPWSEEDCEAAGANMYKQLQEGVSFVPDINRASVNVKNFRTGSDMWEKRDAGDDGLASMVLQI
ncbi:MAG: hypothetical protein Q9220_002266 [cf. Caloplaca sp. 1 TL-2023]